jgi:hypothetical protein
MRLSCLQGCLSKSELIEERASSLRLASGSGLVLQPGVF